MLSLYFVSCTHIHVSPFLAISSFDSEHTHGTGCTLSSAIASALALGQQRRQAVEKDASYAEGATSAIHPVDACCLAKAYVTAGIARGQGVSVPDLMLKVPNGMHILIEFVASSEKVQDQ